MQRRLLCLAVAVFALAVQVAAAAHLPALHEEPVSKSHDVGAHFCAETVEQETGPCVLCQVSLNGVYLEPVDAIRVVLESECVVPSVVQDGTSAFILSSRAPRGPPVG